MISLPPLPQSGSYLQAIRNSTKAPCEKHGVTIESASITRLLTSPAFLSSYQRVSASHVLSLPFNFPSAAAEINLISVLSLLNFGSGYRVPLHQTTRRGAWDNIRAFVFSLYLSSSVGDEGDLLSAKGIAVIGHQKVAELMGVNLHTERPHQKLPGVIVGELGGPVYEFVKIVTETLNGTGQILLNLGYPDLGTFVTEALMEGAKCKSDEAQIDMILERLVRAIPAFQDMTIIGDQPVYCFKKALFLIHALATRFGPTSSSPSSVPVPSTSHIPIFTDNVIPSMLVYLGVINLSASSLSSLFPGVQERLPALLEPAPPAPSNSGIAPHTEGPVLTTDQAYILRAAAIEACDMIVAVARSLDTTSLPFSEAGSLDWINSITLPELDMWIWAVAKDRFDYRQLERFVLRNTNFF